MTNTQIKAQIDTDINNKTVANSILKTNVGDNIKVVVDYVDQEVITKTVKITLSSSQILNLFTTPVQLVPAVSGKLLVPTFLHQKYTYNSTSYTTSGLFRLGIGTTFGFVTFGGSITGADNSQALNNFAFAQSVTGLSYENLPIVVYATSANPASGNGSLDLYLTYLEIDI